MMERPPPCYKDLLHNSIENMLADADAVEQEFLIETLEVHLMDILFDLLHSRVEPLKLSQRLRIYSREISFVLHSLASIVKHHEAF